MRDFFQTFFNVVNGGFVLYMAGYASFLFLSVAVGSASLYGAKRSNFLKNELQKDYYVPVSIVVPAYNESVTIEATVRSTSSMRSSWWTTAPRTKPLRSCGSAFT